MSSSLRTVVNAAMSPFVQGGPWSAASLIDRAERAAGASVWGDGPFRAGLEALLASIGELEDLTPLGSVVFGTMIEQALVNRLAFLGAEEPSGRLIPPIIITGLPRSGTTALHRLLALDRDHHAPPLWELLDPYADSPVALRRWRTRLQIAFKTRLLPELDDKHYTRANTPEECTLLLANSLASPLFWDLAPMDGYLRWYQSTPMEPVYDEYRRQLEVLQRRHPGRRLVLKAPAHLGNLAALHAVLPEAVLVQIHRDPTRCFFSHCSLRRTLTSFVLSRADPGVVGDHVRRVFEHDLDANLAFHDRAPGVVANVSQRRLRSAPIETLRDVYRAAGLEPISTTVRRWKADVDRRRRSRARHHRVSRDGWGVSPDRADAMFGDYRRRFDDQIAEA